MRFLEYKYSDHKDNSSPGWDFESTKLHRLNLLVGATGSGKSRFLNTIFNLAATIRADETKRDNSNGHWRIKFEIDGKQFCYEVEYKKHLDSDRAYVNYESLKELKDDGVHREIIQRDEKNTTFNGDKTPRINGSSLALTVFKDEDDIKPIYSSFGRIYKSDFSSLNPEAGDHNRKLVTFDENAILFLTKKQLPHPYLPEHVPTLQVSAGLWVLSKIHPKKYSLLVATYKSIFPSVGDIRIRNLSGHSKSFIPFAEIKEHLVDEWIPLIHVSSGMQKVIVLMCDILNLPDESIFLIDEYENSLGINAIGFLPDFISANSEKNQFIITTHHPNLINNIDIGNWYLFSRTGSHVKIEHGEALISRFGKSRHTNFAKLLNDPAYTGESNIEN